MNDPILFLQDLAVILVSASIGGYICRRLGLSQVVGYLIAGLVLGTPEIVFPYVTDEQRVAIIAQLGVVFLMFAIGLQFRLNRVRQLGFRIILSTALTALLVLSAVRLSADIIGLSAAAGVALAAVFMNSSSAIISKIIQELGISHERHGQLALGTTLLEDIVAVVMLAVLGSYLAIEGAKEAESVFAIIALLIGFAVLVFILGTLFLPKLIRKVGVGGNSEAISVFVAGILLSTALIAVTAGYSLALGAFLCGMVIAETREKPLIERSFQALKDIFLTIFFVTIGMMVDVKAIPAMMHWIALGIVGALLGRFGAAFISLIVVGEHPRTAMRAAFCLTPLGEFSFIIAGIVVAGGLFPESFQVVVVGTVLGTSLISPLVAAKTQKWTRFIAEGKFPKLDRVHASYSEFWRSPFKGNAHTILWRLLRKRLIQITVELILVCTVLVFAGKIFHVIKRAFPSSFAYTWAEMGVWSAIGILSLISLIAIWRNVSATSMIVSEYMCEGRNFGRKKQFIVLSFLRLVSALFLVIVIWNAVPAELPRQFILLATVILAVPVVCFAWRNFIRIHSEFEWTLDQNLRQSEQNTGRHLFDSWRDEDWDLNLRECSIPDASSISGMTLEKLALRKNTGCSVVGIQRHGFSLVGVGPQTHLFPGDELLLLGSNNQIGAAQKLLTQSGGALGVQTGLENQILKSFKVPENSQIDRKHLGELNWSRLFGVQVVAMRREGVTLTGIDATTSVYAGDLLLLLGSAQHIEQLADQIH